MRGTFVPGIGNLEVQRVYIRVEQPFLFSAINSLGDLYFVSFADITDDGDLWMLTRVSPRRLEEIETRLVDIRTAFVNSEADSIIFVEYYDDDAKPKLSYMLPNDDELTQYLAQSNTFACEAHKYDVEHLRIRINRNYPAISVSKGSNVITRSSLHDIDLRSAIEYGGYSHSSLYLSDSRGNVLISKSA